MPESLPSRQPRPGPTRCIFSPGPGPRAAAPLAAGITAAKLIMLAAAAAGVVAAAALGPMFVALKIAGAAYLIWLGVRMWRRLLSGPSPVVGAAPKVRPVCAAATGLALGMSNPQAIVFYVALLLAVINPGAGAGLYAALAVVLCAAMAVAAVYIALGSRARRAVSSPTARRRADRVAGTLLVGSGVLVATR